MALPSLVFDLHPFLTSQQQVVIAFGERAVDGPGQDAGALTDSVVGGVQFPDQYRWIFSVSSFLLAGVARFLFLFQSVHGLLAGLFLCYHNAVRVF